MAFNYSRLGEFYEREVLKYSNGVEILGSYVLDSVGSSIGPDSSGRYVFPAGTIMQLNGAANQKVIPFNGGPGQIVGILESPAEIVALAVTSADTAVATYKHYAVFATTKVVGFTIHASALISALPTCRWE